MHPRPRLLTGVGLAVVALVVTANGAGAVGFGFAGAALMVALGTAVYAAAAITFLLWVSAPRAVVVALLVTMGAAATVVRAADPSGPVVALFLVMAFAPLRLPLPDAAATAVGVALLFNLEQVRTAAAPALFVMVTDGGAAFFFLMGWLLRREGEQRRELEATRDAERVAAALSERARLARELHDVLAHTLSGLAVRLEGTRLLAQSTGADPQVVTSIGEAHGLARTGLAEAKRAVSALRGDQMPGPEQLPELVEEHRRHAGPCTLAVTGEPLPLGPDARLTLYRTAQEALTNVRKHSPGAATEVTLQWRGHDVHLVVTNKAVGAPAPVGAGYGLTGIAERAQLLGGTCTAGPTATGFRVCLTLPAAA